MTAGGFQLGRFHAAQAGVYATALAELRAGRKRSHWIWFVFRPDTATLTLLDAARGPSDQ